MRWWRNTADGHQICVRMLRKTLHYGARPRFLTFPPDLQFIGDVQQSPVRLHGLFTPDSVNPDACAGD
jgi:hypothetical protein